MEGMLTKVEHGNKFGNAVTLGNNGAFGWQTQYELKIAGGCQRLIMNVINYYNLLYLSDKLRKCQTDTERDELLTTILHSSTHTWHHINLQGEYDFSGPLSTEAGFDVEALKQLELPDRLRRR